MTISTEFVCKCKKQKSWITEGEKTLPCPKCKRKYIGVYDQKKLTIIGKEIKNG
jgi:Zn finger protein HypA/HybF involved in hydrogenase expression